MVKQAVKRKVWFVLLRIPELFLALVLGVLVVFMSISVFSRYVLNIGLSWSDEAARLLFIWIVFVGFAVGVRHRGHIGIDWAVERMSARGRKAVIIVQDVAILFYSLVFLWQSVVTFRFSLLEQLPALRISIAWMYGATLVASVLMVLYGAANLWENIAGKSASADAVGEDSLRHVE
jgi:TRAP-type C4-dicarboxylate transport system permease small subunit